MIPARAVALLVVALAGGRVLVAEDLGIQVPEGFEVSLYADDALAHDIYSMTIDSQGRVVVAGAGYVKILHDTDHDGRADRATLFSPLPASGAHGMVFDGHDLICTGDDSVMRLADADGDGVADAPPEVWTALRDPEHGANGLVRGPDGCYYLICGNDAGVSEKQITTGTSPVKYPRCGGVVRFSPDGRPLDVFAHGFRNPYDLDFDAAGHLFTVDSDGERDHHLPWYAPTRLFDMAQGMEHGWLLQGWMRGWNRPPSFFDNVERIVEIGRGSPTGLTVYRHRAFPAHYRGGVFSACWTLGRVYYVPLEPFGASCRGKLEVFMQTKGDVGFAPCDLAVGPEGDLFVAIGGRRTRGSVFRVHAVGTTASDRANDDPLTQILAADQPLASWSRAAWLPAAQELGKEQFEHAAANEAMALEQRVRAVEILVELWGGPDMNLAKRLAKSGSPAVRARLAWALSRGECSPDSVQILARLTADSELAVARAAWEALAMAREVDPTLSVQPDWLAGLTNQSRRVRAVAIAVARGVGQPSYEKFQAAQSGTAAGRPPSLRLAELWIKLPAAGAKPDRIPFTPADFQTCLQCFASAGSNTPLALESVRLVQVGLGDLRTAPGQAEVYTGYAANLAAQLDAPTQGAIVRQLAPAFPTPDAELNRELTRLLGMLEANDARLLEEIARTWTSKSSVEDDLHTLIVVSLLSGKRTPAVTAATVRCLLRLHGKLEALGQFPSRNWPFRVGEAFDQLCQRDPALTEALLASNDFGQREHTLFMGHLPQKSRREATRKLWNKCVGEGLEPAAELIALAGKLPEAEARPMLLSQWEHGGLRDGIVLALAKAPRAEDRAKFVEALSSPQADVVERSAQALVALGMDCTSADLATALRALKQACSIPKATEPRVSLVRLVDYWTEGNADVEEDPDPSKVYVGWFQMFADYYPAEFARLKKSTGADAESWRRRLDEVAWTSGESARGRALYERRACHRCHEASGHLGPELKGAVSRLSREDLFTAIIDPNLEVSPAFQTTVIATNSGQVYHGVIVYESPEGTLLQTGPDTTVRITDAEQSSVRRSAQSLMPTGLLDTLSDQDLSDLYAYLRTLGSK